MFSFDLFKYILAKQHLGCRVGVAGSMADECITPYSKIVPWTPTSLVEMSRGLSQEVLQEKIILLALMYKGMCSAFAIEFLFNDVDDAEDVSCCNDTVI